MKRKILKYLLSCLMIFSTMIFIDINEVEASGGLSISPSSKSVTSGSVVTFTVSASSDYFIADLSVSVGSGGTLTQSLSKVSIDGASGETATFAVKVTANTTVTVKGTSASYSTETESSASASASITIAAAQSNNSSNSSSNSSSSSSSNSSSNSSSSNTTTTEDTVDTRSSENNLSSLTVSSGTLSPTFSASTTTYKVELTSETSSITVSAKAKDSNATVSGTGEHELKIGENNIIVTVVAENGSKKTYTISVYVTEEPSVYLTYNNQEFGVLSDYSTVDIPSGFEKSTTEIDGQEISILTNDTLGLTLVYLTNGEDFGFYIYDNGEVVREYETLTINGKTYVILNIPSDLEEQDGLVKSTVTIDDIELEGWTFEDENHQNYYVVYLLNEDGERVLYSYETTEGTLQKYVSYVTPEVNHMMTYIFIGTTAIFAISTVAILCVYLRFKRKSIASIKAYYDNKNGNL